MTGLPQHDDQELDLHTWDEEVLVCDSAGLKIFGFLIVLCIWAYILTPAFQRSFNAHLR